MSLYRKVHEGFWKSGTGKNLRGNPNAQVVALYLMTSPHAHMIGIYHCPLIYISHETGLQIEWVEAAIKTLSEAPCKGLASPIEGQKSPFEGQFLTYDWDTEYVFVHRMAVFQIAAHLSPHDKQVKGIKSAVREIPNTLLKRMFLEQYADSFHLHDELAAMPESQPTEGPCKPLASPSEARAVTEAVTEAEHISVEIGAQSKTLTVKSEPSRFDEFWAAYPKKVGRKDAARIWKTKKLDAIADLIVEDVKNRTATHRPWRDGFVLNPSTYLNGERWTDAIETAPAAMTTLDPERNPMGLSKAGAQTANNAKDWLNQQRATLKEIQQ